MGRVGLIDITVGNAGAPRRIATFHHATPRVAPHRYATRASRWDIPAPLARLARAVRRAGNRDRGRSICCVPGPEPFIPGEGARFAAVLRGNQVIPGRLIGGRRPLCLVLAMRIVLREHVFEVIPAFPFRRRRLVAGPGNATGSAEDRHHVGPREAVLVHQVTDQIRKARRPAGPLALFMSGNQARLRLQPHNIGWIIRAPKPINERASSASLSIKIMVASITPSPHLSRRIRHASRRIGSSRRPPDIARGQSIDSRCP
jgi:hypothetical protein